MAIYRVLFLDHGNHVFAVEEIEQASDEEAIKAAQRINVPSIAAGFEVWESERLVHRHRN